MVQKYVGGWPLLARWTTDWDCDHETNWWYVIKDTPFDISSLKAKRRYEITKGNKFFDVKIINPVDNVDGIYQVTIAAYTGWPEKYRPAVTREQIQEAVKTWKEFMVFGAFSRDDGSFKGYAVVEEYREYAAFSILRTNPEAEKQGINAAIVYSILSAFNDRLCEGFYICDGARTIRHETAFQDYLEKYFAFKKSYSNLGIRYRTVIGLAVNVIYPFRKLIKSDSGIGSQVSGILKMEELVRTSRL